MRKYIETVFVSLLMTVIIVLCFHKKPLDITSMPIDRIMNSNQIKEVYQERVPDFVPPMEEYQTARDRYEDLDDPYDHGFYELGRRGYL